MHVTVSGNVADETSLHFKPHGWFRVGNIWLAEDELHIKRINILNNNPLRFTVTQICASQHF